MPVLIESVPVHITENKICNRFRRVVLNCTLAIVAGSLQVPKLVLTVAKAHKREVSLVRVGCLPISVRPVSHAQTDEIERNTGTGGCGKIRQGNKAILVLLRP